ncbi:hypothetical protein [Streptomyces sp. SS]|uniref:hypothetical protein n=1 Tax=Streptomyces sp. SS TaxID=260742 RepID=UPI000302F7BF|nr:hypothetical protein [Streptomyces sp. SS]
MELFARRAADVGVSWQRPADHVAAAEVCRRLEEIPLALELAAAQLPERPVAELARLLRDRLALERSGDGVVRPARHRELRTTVGWSHELCDPLERLLWACLSVFRSDAPVDDVEQVCLGGPLTGRVLESALAGLRRKSLVTLHGDRLRMLDTVREYGRMWLTELGEARATADRHARHARHARHFHDLVVAAEDAWWGPGQAAAYERLAACFGDLRAALEHLLAVDPARAAAMIGGSASSGRAAVGRTRPGTTWRSACSWSRASRRCWRRCAGRSVWCVVCRVSTGLRPGSGTARGKKP